MADNNATLKLPDGKSLEFPVLSGTTGPDVVDIRTLYGKSGMFTYDPGYLSTASCSSSITYIDGDAGVLLYRGYPIEQLAQHCDFLEVCYLLQYGELPNRKQKEEFVDIVPHHTAPCGSAHIAFVHHGRAKHEVREDGRAVQGE